MTTVNLPVNLPVYSEPHCDYDLVNLLGTLRHFNEAESVKLYLRLSCEAILKPNRRNIVIPLPNIGPECKWILETILPLINMATPAQLLAMIELLNA